MFPSSSFGLARSVYAECAGPGVIPLDVEVPRLRRPRAHRLRGRETAPGQERVARLAAQVAKVWLHVERAQAEIVPRYRGGYGVRQFGLWAPDLAPWLQDDTSSMMSLDHYRRLFLEPMKQMSAFPYGVLHLHIPSLHLAEMFAEVPNVRAINLYFDSPTISLSDAMPTLRRLQERRMPLILAKNVYEGFVSGEYEQILDGLSPRGLSVHLKAESVAEGRAVMEAVRTMAKR